MIHHSNERLQTAIRELDAAGIPYYIEDRKKHLFLRYQVDGQKRVVTISRCKKTTANNLMNMRTDLRRSIRELTQTQEKSGDTTMNDITITESNLVVTGDTPRMRDLDVGSALGFGRPDNIRNLIRANLEEMEQYGEICYADKQTSERGGRPSQAYLLNRDQAILISIISRAPKAAAVRSQLIRAFNAWSAHNAGTQALPAPAAEPEIMMNDRAVQVIADEVAKRLSGGTTPKPTTDRNEDLREVMHQIFSWQKSQFEQIGKRLAALPAPENPGIDGVVRQMDASAQTITQSLSQQIQGVVASLQGSIQEIGDRVKEIGVSAPEVAIKPQPDDKTPDDLADINDIYKMLGLKTKKIHNKQSLSTTMRWSLARYAKRRRIAPVTIRNRYGVTRSAYPKELVKRWLEVDGRDLVATHFGRNTLNGLRPSPRYV